jgi:hypothetical protein
MSQVQVVAPIYIQQIWENVEPYLSAALKHSGGEYGIEHLKVFLIQGSQTLLIAVNEDNKIHGAATIEWINYPNERVAYVVCIGGRLVTSKDIWNQFENWVKQNGGTMIRGATYREAARLWKRKFNVEERYIMVEKKL